MQCLACSLRENEIHDHTGNNDGITAQFNEVMKQMRKNSSDVVSVCQLKSALANEFGMYKGREHQVVCSDIASPLF